MSKDPNERDDFWDLSRLVPRKKPDPTPFASARASVSFAVRGTKDEEKDARTKLNLDRILASDVLPKTKEESVYIPAWSPLLTRVLITRYTDRYDFYDVFRKSAVLYFDKTAPACDFAQFYSYMPQYSQFSEAQKNYYFYWRGEVRKGIFPKTDYSYLYLLVYEVLNLPELIKPEDGIAFLCRLWNAYRKDLPNIDAQFARWVEDYCLLYALPCPYEDLAPLLSAAIGASTFKEFYFADIGRFSPRDLTVLIANLSDYDFRRSKYAFADGKTDYEKFMAGALAAFFTKFLGEYIAASEGDMPLIRPAFPNTLCTHSVKCRLNVSYRPLTCSAHVRAVVTSAVKYAENKYRALIGVKSRLGVKELPDALRLPIDSYADRVNGAISAKQIKQETPAYMHAYDAPSEELSFAGADEIEQASWLTTERLIPAEEKDSFAQTSERNENTDRYSTAEDITAEIIPPQEIAVMNEDANLLTVAEIGYLSAILSGDPTQIRDAVSYAGIPIDTVAEHINTFFADLIGDVILDPSPSGYELIEDYREEVRQWLDKQLKG